jgi:hypothetical protein
MVRAYPEAVLEHSVRAEQYPLYTQWVTQLHTSLHYSIDLDTTLPFWEMLAASPHQHLSTIHGHRQGK